MLIDLGEVRGPFAEAAHGDDRRSLWRKALLVISMLPVLSAGAAAASPPPEVLVVADVQLPGVFGSIDFVGGAVIHRSREAVSVYERDGRLRWTAPVPDAAGEWSAMAEQGLILIFSHATDTTRTVALDLADGRELWSFPGLAGVMGEVVTVSRGTGGGYAVYDRANRTLLWRTDGLSFAADRAAGSVLGLAHDGTLSERELRTGRTIRSIRLDLPPSQFYSINFHDGDIVVAYHLAGGDVNQLPGVIQLDRANLTVERSAFGWAGQMNITSPNCGQVRCEVTFGGNRMRTTVFDPSSGERLWEAPPSRDLQLLPSGLTSFESHRSGSAPTIQVHDPRTGQIRRTISGWWPIRAGVNGPAIAPVLMREHAGTRPVHTFLAGLTPAGLRVLGSLRHEFIECRYDNEYLACMTVTRRLMVMRIEPAVDAATDLAGQHGPPQRN